MEPFNHKPEREELIARYIFNSSKFNVNTKEIHHKHFEPQYVDDTKRYETSIMRLEGLDNTAKDSIGIDYVGASRGISPKGYIEFKAHHIADLDLEIEPETESHPRHGNIISWPKDDEDRLEKQKLLAKNISNNKDESIYKKYD